MSRRKKTCIYWGIIKNLVHENQRALDSRHRKNEGEEKEQTLFMKRNMDMYQPGMNKSLKARVIKVNKDSLTGK